MTHKTKNPVLAGTGSEVHISGQLTASEYNHVTPKVHRIVQAERLRHRFGMTAQLAALTAFHAYDGGAS